MELSNQKLIINLPFPGRSISSKCLVIFSLVLGLLLLKSTSNAQISTSKYNFGIIFKDYIAIKNALVNNDGTMAKIKASELHNLLIQHPDKGLSHDQWKLLASYLEQLIDYSRPIALTISLDEQRLYFAKLSATMFDVLKRLRINTSPIYEQYCAMDKLTWLNDKPTITNPYHFSKDMVSCGKVIAILHGVR